MPVVVKGPGEAFSQGLLAGSKLKSMRAERETLKLQNELLAKQLQYVGEEFELKKRLTVANINRAEAQDALFDQQLSLAEQLEQFQIAEAETGVRTAKAGATTAEANAELAPQLAQANLDAKTVSTDASRASIRASDASVDATRQQSAESKQRVAASQAGVQSQQFGNVHALLASVADPEMTREDAYGIVELQIPQLQELGVPIEPGDKHHHMYAAQTLSYGQQEAQELEMEREKNAALNIYRNETLGIRQQTANTGDNRIQADAMNKQLGQVADEMESVRGSLDQVTLYLQQDPEKTDPELLKSLVTRKKELETKLEDLDSLRKEIRGELSNLLGGGGDGSYNIPGIGKVDEAELRAQAEEEDMTFEDYLEALGASK